MTFRPVKARLNRSLFPSDLLTISARRRRMEGVSLVFESTDRMMKARSGGDPELGTLEPGESIDVLIADDFRGQFHLPQNRFTHLQAVPREGAFVLTMSWESVGGRSAPGKVVVLWTNRDRLSGARPRIAFDAEADALREYTNTENPLSGRLMQLRDRVRPLGRFDIWLRYRREKGVKVAATELPAAMTSSVSVLGFRGFREEATLKLAEPRGGEGSGLTIVVGANNAGKSTVWESFDAIARKAKSDVSFSIGRRNRGAAEGIRLALRRTEGSTYIVNSLHGGTS